MTQHTLTGTPTTTVVNVRKTSCEGVVMVDRSTKYGNPYRMEKDGGDYSREGCIEAFREWWYADGQEELRRQAIEELQGETLGCWCKPKACHADVIAAYLNSK